MADILVFAPHPDDAEIGAGGTIARHCRLGYEVVVCDLSLGEMATNGEPGTRAGEARGAAGLLGLAARECLGLADRHLEPTPERVRVVAEAVRRWRPDIVLAPWAQDRHPDHTAASRLVREGVFDAGLARYQASGPAHRCRSLVWYFVNAHPEPDFVVDVSDVYEIKREALASYRSQFDASPSGGGFVASSGGGGTPGPHPTPINQGYLEWVELRDSWYGSLAGVARGEGFAWEGTVLVDDLPLRLRPGR